MQILFSKGIWEIPKRAQLERFQIRLQKAEEREGPVQGRLYRSLKLWSFYCDLEESLGTIESTRAVYNKILELRIATPQIILNFALFLQVGSGPGFS